MHIIITVCIHFVTYQYFLPLLLLGFCFYHGFTAPSSQGFLIIEDSRSHSDTPQSVGLLWTSDQPDAETCAGLHATLTRDRNPCPRWDSNPQSQQASGRRPKPKIALPMGQRNCLVIYCALPKLWVRKLFELTEMLEHLHKSGRFRA